MVRVHPEATENQVGHRWVSPLSSRSTTGGRSSSLRGSDDPFGGRVQLEEVLHGGFELLSVLTVQRRFWYRVSSRTMLAVLVAMENSCCSVTLDRKPLNMKMLGAMTTETLLRVILFLAWWSITRLKNSTSA
ncbi:hypothetical protein EYF80_042293 [Liparis tanakae]|uniref:Uncharacterized protein n=1 Tax=Liparis tanakae TaxID=230148 RepID=A0A4Z2G1T2_9TELE|nr:hypothetical protein EYF80_042293 [Liparis tanakae]